MAGDSISSVGDDTVVGDSAALFVQISSVHENFEFEEVDKEVAQGLDFVLSAILKQRQDELDIQVRSLGISDRLSDHEISNLLFADVPVRRCHECSLVLISKLC